MNSFMQNLYKRTPSGNARGQWGSSTPPKPGSPVVDKEPFMSLSQTEMLQNEDSTSMSAVDTTKPTSGIQNCQANNSSEQKDTDLYFIDKVGNYDNAQVLLPSSHISTTSDQSSNNELAPDDSFNATTTMETQSRKSSDSNRTDNADMGPASQNHKRKLEESGAKSTSKKSKKRLWREDGEKLQGPEVQMSTVTFAQIGGCDKTLVDLCKLLMHMKHPEVYQQLGVSPPRGILLHGPPGCGKTLLVHAVAGELELPLLKMAATEVVSGVSGESEEKLRKLFEKATSSSPCVLFIDEIDAISQKRENASKDMERRIVSQLLACMDDLNNDQSVQVMVFGATTRPDSLDPGLRRAGRFDREIAIGIPDEEARKNILEVICRDLKLEDGFDFLALAHSTPGYVGADLNALAREATMIAVNRVFLKLHSDSDSVSTAGPTSQDETTSDMIINENEKKAPEKPEVSHKLQLILNWLKEHSSLTAEQLAGISITWADFQEAIVVVQPSAKREGFATVPDVTWEDIGALHEVREELQLAIMAPVRHPQHFSALGLTNPPGILLAGPPGCGKTLLAKAIANESGINFISVKGPELLSMYVGESERAVRQVFQRARNSAPCVIFFDELDALCPKRTDSGEGGASVRVVNQLLTEMDGLQARKQVFIMGATNRPDIIDPAIMRPGRLDKLLYVGLPILADRLDILKAITKNGTKPPISADTDLAAVAADERCCGYTGADLAALVREAAVAALKEFMVKADEQLMNDTVVVQSEHFHAAFLKVLPSVSDKENAMYEKIKQRCRKH